MGFIRLASLLQIVHEMSSERAYQFFRLVERMRDKQKEYFRTRNEAVLNESKQLERDVDKEIQRVNNALGNRQPSLFGAEIAKSEGWHDCKDKGDIPQSGEWCLLRAEHVCGGETIVNYFITSWKSGGAGDCLDKIADSHKDYNITHWRYINKDI